MGTEAVAGMAPAGRRYASSVGRAGWSGLRRKSRPLRRAALVALALIFGFGLHLSRTGDHWVLSICPAQADNIQYVYDELGRLVQAADLTSGQAVQYTYDAAGNISSRTAVALSTLSVGYVSTQQGSPGSQITIDGTGFSTTSADDIVSFNGTPATVVSATATELVVTVPAGASSGPITVQVGGTTLTSGSFTVTSGASGPAITSLLPAIGTAGTIVTVSGTGFDPNPSHDRAQFNASLASVTGSSPTTISTAVPVNAGSGKVQVMTPSGMATSPMDFIVVPSGYSASSISSTGRLPTDGTSTTLTLAATHISVQLFDGSAGDLLTIGIGSLSVANATIKIFKPDGTSLTSGTVSSSGQGVQLPKLPITGTYTVVVDPGSNSGSVTLNIVKPLQATLALNGTPTSVSITPPGRRTLLTFTGTQGVYASIALSGVTVSAGTISVIAPNGAVLESAPFGTSNGGGGIEPELPQNGLYTVLIDPTGSVGGALNVALTTSSSPTLGIGQSVNVNLPNQTPVDVTFQATAGQYLSVGISENQSGVSGATFKVLKPDGTTLTSGSFSGSTCGGNGIGCSGYSGNSVINLGSVPMGGTYTIVVQQTGSGSGTITLTLSAPVIKNLSAGTASSVTASLTGQAMQLTFSGEAGQYMSFAVSENQDLIPSATITVVNPDGSVLTTGSFSGQPCPSGTVGCTGSTGTGVLNLGPLLMSGTYTVLVQQTTGGTGTLTFTVSSPVTQALSVGTPSNVTASLQGQGMQLTFPGTKGQYLALALGEQDYLIPGATVTVLNPDGTQLASGSFTATWCGGFGCAYFYGTTVVNIGPLPQDGSYTVLIQQVTSNSQISNLNTGTLNVTLSSAVQATASAGSSVTEMASLAGQPIQLTFSGSTGQYFSLAVQEQNEGDIPGAAITVFAPDGKIVATGTLATASCGTGCNNGDTTVNMGPLSETGTFTVLIQQTGAGGTGGLNLTLTNPVVGALSTGSTVTPVVSLAGQSFEETFSGAVGQFFSLSVHEYDEGDIAGAAITVLAPNGATAATGALTTTTCGSGCDNGDTLINMGPLAASGTYTVLIQQTNAGTGGLDLALSNPVNGGTLSPSTPALVPTTLLGQGLQVSFAGSAGAAVDLHVEEDSGSNISGAGITIYNPDGTPLSNGTLNTTVCSGCGYTGSTDLYPSVLPETGTYTVVAQQKSAGTGTLSFTATGIQPATGSTNTYSTSTAGQAVTFTFTATAGQSMSLALTNVVISPNSPAYVNVRINNPNGSLYTSVNCYTNGSGCEFSLFSLPQSGTYQVQVNPASSSQTMSFTTTLSADVTGALSLNTPINVSLGAVGQSGVLTFTATAGQTVALNIGGLTTIPASTSIEMIVYNSSGTQVGSASSSSGATVNVPNLAADTYRLLVYPTMPATSSLQVTLEAGTTGALSSNGSSTSYSTAAPGQSAYLTFSGTAGQSVSLALTNVGVGPGSPAYVTVRINSPNGSLYASSSCYPSGSGCELSLFGLPQTGTYQVQVTPVNISQTMSFTATLSGDVTGTLPLNSPSTVSLGTVGQSGVFTFTATAGQTVALNLGGLTTIPASTTLEMIVYNSLGTQVASAQNAVGATINLPNLAAGTYQVQLYPATPATSSMQVTLEAGVTGVLPSNGSSSSYTTSVPNQNVYLTFSGTAGQSMNLALTNVALTPSSPAYVQVNITKPDGTSVASGNCWTSGSGCEFPLFNLPESGTYQVQVNASSGTGQKASFTTNLSADVTASLALNTPIAVSLGSIGQNELLTFTATAGQAVALNMSGVTTTPANTPVAMVVYNSSGTQLASAQSAVAATISLPNLAAGTYQVLLYPATPAASTSQVELDQTSLSSNGSSSSYSTTSPGQNGYFTFSGTAGQSMSLALTNLVVTPGSPGYVQVFVYKPDGTSFDSGNCWTGNAGCEYTLFNLPQSGTYQVEINPASGNAQTMSYTLTLSINGSGTLALNAPATVNLGSMGQGEVLTFTAMAGQPMALNMSGVTTTPANTPVEMIVYNSSGTQVTSAQSTVAATINLPNLAAGTYQVLLYPATPATSTFQVDLDQTSLSSNGSSSSYSTTSPGQNGYFTFSGTAGQSMSLALTNLVLTPSSPGYVQVFIYKPDGTSLDSGNCWTGNAGCEYTLFNLPQTGTYQVEINPASGNAQTMSYTLTLSIDASGTLALNAPTTVNLGSVGQSDVLTFTATAGQPMALNMSGVTTTPANTSVEMIVYNSSGTQVTSAQSTVAATINLPNLAAGTYQVLLYPTTPATSALQMDLDQTSLSSNGISASYSTTSPGQNGYFTFSGTAGQSMSLALTNLVLTPASPGYMQVSIYKPDGTSFASGNCWTGGAGCEYTLFKLPQTGTYQVEINPTSGNAQTMSFTLTLSTDASGTLSQGVTSPVDLSELGQGSVLSFTATAGENVGISASNIVTSPSGVTEEIYVYNASGSQIGSTSTSSGTTLNLSNLAAGNYSVLVYPNTPATSNIQIGYQ